MHAVILASIIIWLLLCLLNWGDYRLTIYFDNSKKWLDQFASGELNLHFNEQSVTVLIKNYKLTAPSTEWLKKLEKAFARDANNAIQDLRERLTLPRELADLCD